MTFDRLDHELLVLILSYATGRRKQQDNGYDIDIRTLWKLRSVSRLFKKIIDEFILRSKKDMILTLGYHSLGGSSTEEQASELASSISSMDHEPCSERSKRQSLINVFAKTRCLECLFFQGGSNGINDEFLEEVQAIIPQLRLVSLQQCCRFTARGLLGFDNLKEVDLSHCRQVDDEFILALSFDVANDDRAISQGSSKTFLGQLVHLRLRWCVGISDAAIKHISKHCSNLKILDLNGCESVTDYSIMHLASNPSIRENLEELYVSYCYIGNVGLAELKSFLGLRVLALAHQLYNNFPSGYWTTTGIQGLMESNPKLKIVHQ